MPLQRRRHVAALGAVVTLAHLWLADVAIPPRLGDGAGDAMPRRIDVAFVRDLAQSAPPAAAPVSARAQARAPARVARAVATDAAASAPAAAASAPGPAPTLTHDAPAEPPPLAAAEPPPAPAEGAASAPAAVQAAQTAQAASTAAADPAAPAASTPATAFEWPPSTRLSYRFTGNYRGPVSGHATVEWLRQGGRYQVQMEVVVGSDFAPLLRRRVASEGDITPQGLSPRRYDEETKALVGAARRNSILMDGATVRLANGSEVPRPPGLQDSASQFVHLTWLFTTQPEWLQPGRTIELPLALPRRVEPWTYDVLASETLDTPAGPVPAVHVKPRRPPKPGDTLTAELWVAPSLQYLPVRILIRQDAETYVDMVIERLPQQAVER